ncbi:hypothetical protein HWD94_03970 [Pseudarthrobacter equi]|uniref:hypothetical protein n=1 Tax=Pseudarthrobacter equi TaxID=728066 RepID=UPI0021BFC4EA|nr:hypothetical protein [Pseudarthrobacter equi]MCT9624280.1 hypothetical protein [Pseudarthrobacter equi]
MAEPLLGTPDGAGITITGLGVGPSVVTIWRTADNNRKTVQGERRVIMNDAGYLVDHFAPLGRDVTYELEVLSGPLGPTRALAAPIMVPSTTGWLSDALVPQNSVPLVGRRTSKGDVYLQGEALAALEYQSDISLYQVMGNSEPMALFGPRMAASGVDTSVGTRSEAENARLQDLLRSTAQLVFRPLPEWGDLGLEGTMYLANPTARRVDVNRRHGGEVTWWELKSAQVAAPAIRVLTGTFSYGDVEIMLSTYQQKQDLMAGKKYLDDLKNPLGG